MSSAPHFAHSTAIVDEGAEIGEGTRLWHFVHISAGARVGARCSLGQNVFVGRDVKIGDGVKIQNNVSIYEGVEIEEDAFLGPHCVFTNVNNPRSFIERKIEYRATRIGRGATIGANATIVCGHEIGPYAFVGAGAVVTKHVPSFALVVGNPAKRIGWVCRCGVRLPEGRSPCCGACGAAYRVDGEVCRASANGEFCRPVTAPEPESDDPVPLVDLVAQNRPLLPALREAFDRVASSGQFVLGEEVSNFERDIASYLCVPHAVGVSSGTDALLAALMALGVRPGDEVITTPFSFFATAGCIARLGARPVFVDIDPATFNLDPTKIERAITPKTRALLPVHLFGQPCAPQAIRDIAHRRGLAVIEDAAQAIGARSSLGPVGGLGTVGCFSFFPSKNLGALGDGGLVTTADAAMAERLRVLRAHGGKPKHHHEEIGGNFRLDALQAAMLRVKLFYLDGWAEARRANARAYTALFAEADLPPQRLSTPREVEQGHVWNQYVIRTERRDALRAHLEKANIATEIYYPVPLHLQKCFAYLDYKEGDLPEAERAAREVLALPIFPELGDTRLRRVVREIVRFLSSPT